MTSDNDWIEVAYVFDRSPSCGVLRSAFRGLMEHSRRENDAGTFAVAYWDDPSDIVRLEGDETDAARACSNYEAATVTIPFDGFELRVGRDHTSGCLASTPHLILREEVHPFTEPWDSESTHTNRRRHFTEILAQAGELLDPAWAFGRRGGAAVEPGESPTALASSMRPPLYEYNLFHETVVNDIGRERIHSAPAWNIEDLETGSIFLVTREPPRSCTPNEPPCAAVAEHLGLSVADVDE